MRRYVIDLMGVCDVREVRLYFPKNTTSVPRFSVLLSTVHSEGSTVAAKHVLRRQHYSNYLFHQLSNLAQEDDNIA
jgi:hypothetical protein